MKAPKWPKVSAVDRQKLDGTWVCTMSSCTKGGLEITKTGEHERLPIAVRKARLELKQAIKNQEAMDKRTAEAQAKRAKGKDK